MPGKLSTDQTKALEHLLRLVETPAQLGLTENGDPAEIQLFQRNISNRDMECFRYFTGFKSIGLGDNSGVTDEGLRHIAHLKELEFLDLQNTGVTDAGLVHVMGLTNLRHLDLNWLPITDSGARHLEGLFKLKKLIIREDADGISNEAYERLLSAIPGLEIGN